MSSVAESRPPGQHYCPTCEKMFADGDTCPTDGSRLVKLKAVVDPLLGRNLDGRYTITEKLGQGGMGAVYRGAQHSVGREVAIKLVGQHLVGDPDVIKRFLREAKLASRLSHPNAVQVLDFGQTDDGLFYLVMELVAGRTLDQVIKAEGVFRPERVVRIGAQVCNALEVAHSLQIVHRDLKPANIMLLAQGRDIVKVLDFGLAKSLAPDQTSTTMTNAGALLGTPAFMPPELALGLSCDGRADLYSLGCVLFLLGSGRLPFVSDSAHELIAMHGTEPAPTMPGVPETLAAVVGRLLAKAPEDRYQTAADARDALEAAIEGRIDGRMTPPLGLNDLRTSATTTSPFAAVGSAPAATPVPPSMVQLERPKRTRGWLAALLVLVLGGAGSTAFVLTQPTSPAPAAEPAPTQVETTTPTAPPPATGTPATATTTTPPTPPTTTTTTTTPPPPPPTTTTDPQAAATPTAKAPVLTPGAGGTVKDRKPTRPRPGRQRPIKPKRPDPPASTTKPPTSEAGSAAPSKPPKPSLPF